MRLRFRFVPAALLLIAPFCTAQTTLAAQEGDASLYSRVIRAEMKAGGLDQHDTVCLALPHYADPNKSLLKALKADGLTIKKPDKCLFRGYEIRVEQSTPDSIRVQLVDVRYVDTDLAVILRDGIYGITRGETDEWSTRDYRPFQPSDKK